MLLEVKTWNYFGRGHVEYLSNGPVGFHYAGIFVHEHEWNRTKLDSTRLRVGAKPAS